MAVPVALLFVGGVALLGAVVLAVQHFSGSNPRAAHAHGAEVPREQPGDDDDDDVLYGFTGGSSGGTHDAAAHAPVPPLRQSSAAQHVARCAVSSRVVEVELPPVISRADAAGQAADVDPQPEQLATEPAEAPCVAASASGASRCNDLRSGNGTSSMSQLTFMASEDVASASSFGSSSNGEHPEDYCLPSAPSSQDGESYAMPGHESSPSVAESMLNEADAGIHISSSDSTSSSLSFESVITGSIRHRAVAGSEPALD